jgi:hypothetical protein
MNSAANGHLEVVKVLVQAGVNEEKANKVGVALLQSFFVD